MLLSSGVVWRHRELERLPGECPEATRRCSGWSSSGSTTTSTGSRARRAGGQRGHRQPADERRAIRPAGLTAALLHAAGAVRSASRCSRVPGDAPVILATGGFAAERELVRRYVTPEADQLLLRAAPGGTGDGLRLGLAAGGRRRRASTRSTGATCRRRRRASRRPNSSTGPALWRATPRSRTSTATATRRAAGRRSTSFSGPPASRVREPSFASRRDGSGTDRRADGRRDGRGRGRRRAPVRRDAGACRSRRSPGSRARSGALRSTRAAASHPGSSRPAATSEGSRPAAMPAGSQRRSCSAGSPPAPALEGS